MVTKFFVHSKYFCTNFDVLIFFLIWSFLDLVPWRNFRLLSLILFQESSLKRSNLIGVITIFVANQRPKRFLFKNSFFYFSTCNFDDVEMSDALLQLCVMDDILLCSYSNRELQLFTGEDGPVLGKENNILTRSRISDVFLPC